MVPRWSLRTGFSRACAPPILRTWLHQVYFIRMHQDASGLFRYVQVPWLQVVAGSRKVDIRLPGKENSNSHGARPVHQIISRINWIRTSRLSINNSLSGCRFLVTGGFGWFHVLDVSGFRFQVSGFRARV